MKSLAAALILAIWATSSTAMARKATPTRTPLDCSYLVQIARGMHRAWPHVQTAPKKVWVALKNHTDEYKKHGFKRLLMAPDVVGLDTKFTIFAEHPTEDSLAFFEKKIRYKAKNGKIYTLRPVEGIYKKVLSPLTREHARNGEVFVDSMASSFLLASLGVFSAFDHATMWAEKKIIEHNENEANRLATKYLEQNYWFNDLRTNAIGGSTKHLVPSDAASLLEDHGVLKTMSEIRMTSRMDFSHITEEDMLSLQKKIRSVLDGREELNILELETVLLVILEDNPDLFTKREKTALKTLIFGLKLNTFVAKKKVLARSMAYSGGATNFAPNDDSVTQRYNEQGTLNMLYPGNLKVVFDTIADHLNILNQTAQADHLMRTRKEIESSEMYQTLYGFNKAFRDWRDSNHDGKLNNAHISFYLNAQADKASLYRLYDRMGIRPQLLKNGNFVDIPLAAYDKAYPAWAQKLQTDEEPGLDDYAVLAGAVMAGTGTGLRSLSNVATRSKALQALNHLDRLNEMEDLLAARTQLQELKLAPAPQLPSVLHYGATTMADLETRISQETAKLELSPLESENLPRAIQTQRLESAQAVSKLQRESEEAAWRRLSAAGTSPDLLSGKATRTLGREELLGVAAKKKFFSRLNALGYSATVVASLWMAYRTHVDNVGDEYLLDLDVFLDQIAELKK